MCSSAKSVKWKIKKSLNWNVWLIIFEMENMFYDAIETRKRYMEKNTYIHIYLDKVFHFQAFPLNLILFV